MEAIGVIGGALASAAPYIGAGLTAAGSIYSGVRKSQEADIQAKALKQKGDQELSRAAQIAQQHAREGRLAISRARAVAAASGAGTADDTVTSIMAGIEGKARKNALIDMYNGFQSRADLYSEAAATKREGNDAVIGSLLNAGSSIYSGIARERRRAREDAYYSEDY